MWFVTGASKGRVLALTQKLLNEVHKVAATSRNVQALNDAVGNNTANFLPLAVDLPEETDVQTAIQATIEKSGRPNVVVNNAGFGLIGAPEELSGAELRSNFNVNVLSYY